MRPGLWLEYIIRVSKCLRTKGMQVLSMYHSDCVSSGVLCVDTNEKSSSFQR